MNYIKIANHMPDRQKCGIASYSQSLYAEAESKSEIKLFPFDTKFRDLFSLFFKPVDIVHFQHEFGIWPVMGLGFILYLIKFRLINLFTKKKIVVTMHTVWDLEKIDTNFSHYSYSLRWIISLYLWISYIVIINFSHKILCLNKDCVKLLQNLTTSKDKIAYLPHGLFKAKNNQIPFEVLANRFSISPKDKLITMFGFAYPNKGFDLVIKSLPEVMKKIPLAKLVVAGSAPRDGGQGYMEELIELAKVLKIQDKIIFTGYLEDKDLALQAIFQHSTCFVYPYYKRSSASGSISTIFGMSKPILVSDIDFFKEYNFLPKFKEGDIADLTLQLVKLLSVSSGEPSYQKNILEMQNYFNKHSITEVFNKQYNIFLNLIYDSNS
jgi:glycosyltransferase involved in cell wall biosynthesis